jgi:hypothetical protein
MIRVIGNTCSKTFPSPRAPDGTHYVSFSKARRYQHAVEIVREFGFEFKRPFQPQPGLFSLPLSSSLP